MTKRDSLEKVKRGSLLLKSIEKQSYRTKASIICNKIGKMFLFLKKWMKNVKLFHSLSKKRNVFDSYSQQQVFAYLCFAPRDPRLIKFPRCKTLFLDFAPVQILIFEICTSEFPVDSHSEVQNCIFRFCTGADFDC